MEVRDKQKNLDQSDEAYRVGLILKSQGDLLRAWGDAKGSVLSSESVAGLGDLLRDLGERLCSLAP